MKDIVITAGEAVGSVLELAQSIKKDVMCKTIVLCTNQKKAKIIQASKFIDSVIIIDNDTEIEYIESIKSWFQSVKFEEKPILYFTTDTSCFYINKNRKWFEDRFELCLPSSNIIKTYTQKGLAEVGASEAGLAVPKTQVINNSEDIKKVINDFSFPVILKPRATYLKDGIDFKLKVISNKNKLFSFSSSLIENENSFLCQEFIPGGYSSSYYYLFYRSKDGKVLANMGKRILQTGPDGGLMAKGITEFNSELSLICERYLKTINYFGFGGLEFKEYNDKYYFIEMNVRIEAILKIAEKSNSPLALLSYYDLSDNDLKVSKLMNSEQKDGVIYMDFLVTLGSRIRSKHYFTIVSDLFSSVFNADVKLNIFNKKDSKPFWLTIKNRVFR